MYLLLHDIIRDGIGKYLKGYKQTLYNEDRPVKKGLLATKTKTVANWAG